MNNDQYQAGIVAARAVDATWSEADAVSLAELVSGRAGPLAEQVRIRRAMHRDGRCHWSVLRDHVVVLAWEGRDDRPRSLVDVRNTLA